MFDYQCNKCIEEGKGIGNSFHVVAKTFYKLKDTDILMCYRHWHQANRPKHDAYGSYAEVSDVIRTFKKSKKLWNKI